MILTKNTRLKHFILMQSLTASPIAVNLPVRLSFWWLCLRWKFFKSIWDMPFYDFQVAQKYSSNPVHIAFLLLELHSGKKRQWVQKIVLWCFLNMPVKKILSIGLFYQSEFANIAKEFERQNDMLSKIESSKYSFEEFGYSTVSYMLANGNRQMAREFIDRQSVAYVLVEYRREIKRLANEQYLAEQLTKKYKKQ